MGFEELIRDTIAKQGASDPAAREKVYQSARAAMERMISRDVNADAARAGEQRERLEEAIRRIETEQGQPSPGPVAAPTPSITAPLPPTATPAPPMASPPPVAAPTAPPPVAAPAARATPEPVRPVPRPDGSPPRVVPPPAAQARRERVRVDAALHGGPRPKRGRRSRPFATLLLWTIVLTGLGAAVWWSITFGPRYLEDSLGAVANPPRVSEGDSYDPAGGDGWIEVFEAAENAATLDPGANGLATLDSAGEDAFVRLARRGDGPAEVRIPVPPGVMQTIRGRRATFELVARADATDQPFALSCEFGDAGGCGRKRFAAAPQQQSFLFDTTLGSDGTGAGAIVIDPDLAPGAAGRPLDVYSLRVRTE